jgi:two-component system OmpR family sensor kinase
MLDAAGRARSMRGTPSSLSLAIRLPITTAMVVAAALLAVFGLTAQVTRHHLATALDQRIRASVDSFRDGPAARVTDAGQLSGEAARWLSAQALANDEVVAVHTVDGDVVTSTGGLDLRELPRAAELLTADRTRWWELSTRHGVVRALTVPLLLDGRHIGTLVVAASRAAVDATLRALLSSIGWASGFGLVFATVLAFAAVRRTLRPLLRMSRQVDGIHASGDLTRRVGPPGPRDEVGRLAEGFNRLLARVDDAFRSQRRFVSDASHELRTPLTVARGQIELAATAPENVAAPENLTAAVVELDRMSRIVEELLLLARLDEGLPMRREPVEVELVVEEALLRGLRLAAGAARPECGPQRQVRVDAEPGLYALADPDRLLQVLSNLVVNAVQHAGDQAALALATRRTGDEVVVDVSDTGPGIPADALPHVFDRFYRGTTRAGGAGLGLAIADSLTRAMSGRLTVSSATGVGTTFTVRVPAAQESSSASSRRA